MKGESGSFVTSKIAKLKSKVMKNKGKDNKDTTEDGTKSLEVASKKFTSNGSLLSQNGLKAAYSEPDLGMQQQPVALVDQQHPHQPGQYVHMVEGESVEYRVVRPISP